MPIEMTKREELSDAGLLDDSALNGVAGGAMDGVSSSGHSRTLGGGGSAGLPPAGGGAGGSSTITPGGSGGAPSGIQPK